MNHKSRKSQSITKDGYELYTLSKSKASQRIYVRNMQNNYVFSIEMDQFNNPEPNLPSTRGVNRNAFINKYRNLVTTSFYGGAYNSAVLNTSFEPLLRPQTNPRRKINLSTLNKPFVRIGQNVRSQVPKYSSTGSLSSLNRGALNFSTPATVHNNFIKQLHNQKITPEQMTYASNNVTSVLGDAFWSINNRRRQFNGTKAHNYKVDRSGVDENDYWVARNRLTDDFNAEVRQLQFNSTNYKQTVFLRDYGNLVNRWSMTRDPSVRQAREDDIETLFAQTEGKINTVNWDWYVDKLEHMRDSYIDKVQDVEQHYRIELRPDPVDKSSKYG